MLTTRWWVVSGNRLPLTSRATTTVRGGRSRGRTSKRMWNDDLSDHGRAGLSLGGGTAIAGDVAGAHGAVVLPSLRVTVFRCVNCSGPGAVRPSGNGDGHARAEVGWPIGVHEVALPCAGRLQPEHLLKAFEAGADAVCVITCAEDSCHYLEGSRRVERRIEYVRRLLDEIGLGGERLMVFHLTPSAQEQATLGHVPNGPWRGTQPNGEEDGSRLAEIGEMVVAGVGALQPNPLRQNGATS
jgi:coenzyme F420-reducing hydrogenase delta subunit